jgi:hypothetical protein
MESRLNNKLQELREDLNIATIQERKIIWTGKKDVEYRFIPEKGSNHGYSIPVIPLSVKPLVEKLSALIENNELTESEIDAISEELEEMTSRYYDKSAVYGEHTEPYKFTADIRMIGKMVDGKRTEKKYAVSLEGLVKVNSIARVLGKSETVIEDVLNDICGKKMNLFNTEEEAQEVADKLNVRLQRILNK